VERKVISDKQRTLPLRECPGGYEDVRATALASEVRSFRRTGNMLNLVGGVEDVQLVGLPRQRIEGGSPERRDARVRSKPALAVALPKTTRGR
jgi:hypothetical protein